MDKKCMLHDQKCIHDKALEDKIEIDSQKKKVPFVYGLLQIDCNEACKIRYDSRINLINKLNLGAKL